MHELLTTMVTVNVCYVAMICIFMCLIGEIHNINTKTINIKVCYNHLIYDLYVSFFVLIV